MGSDLIIGVCLSYMTLLPPRAPSTMGVWNATSLSDNRQVLLLSYPDGGTEHQASTWFVCIINRVKPSNPLSCDRGFANVIHRPLWLVDWYERIRASTTWPSLIPSILPHMMTNLAHSRLGTRWYHLVDGSYSLWAMFFTQRCC